MKNLGPGVSGYLDPSGRSFESTIYQAGKPVLDKELNLAADILNGFARALRLPSGWIAGDFVDTSSSSAIVQPSSVANELLLVNGLTANVNGWVFIVSDTGADGANLLDLGAGPVGAGTKRTDLVILEVWRRLLSAAPDVDGKSPSGRIWKNGNVKIASADDLTKNFSDDILDANVASETTKRVQLQYRLRVIQGVDIFAYPSGIDDPSVVANGVPPNAATPDGSASAFGFTNQSANGDPGLWVAGDGDPSNGLGTVDGYVYAIPLLAVFRRNTTAFDRNTNHNGGVASPGPSDRPDGLFADIIDPKDVADLRHAVCPGGWNHTELLAKNVNLLLDNTLSTEWATTPNGGGYSGHTVLWADEIGITNVNGGNGTTTGDTPGATFIGEFDSVRRTFSDRAIYEVITVPVSAPVGGWVFGSTFTIDPTTLTIYPYSPFNWAGFNSAQVIFVDVVAARFLGAPGEVSVYDGLSRMVLITGLAQSPLGPLEFTLGDVAGGSISTQTLYVDILVAYPEGLGLTRTPVNTFGSSGITVNNPAQLSPLSPINFDVFAGSNDIDPAHREATLQYRSSLVSFTVTADIGGSPIIYLPERVDAVASVTVNAVPIIGTVTLDDSGRFFSFNNVADFPSPGDIVAFDYNALRPIPQCGVQFTLYYDVRAPQTISTNHLGTTITLTPRLVGDFLYVVTTGSGSQSEGYPFPFASTQMGGVYPSSTGNFNGEHELSSSGNLEIPGFTVSSGLLKLPVLVPFVPAPEVLIFNRAPTDVDIEDRSYFNAVPVGYLPNAYGQSLVNTNRHRNMLPILVETSTDGPLGAKGQILLLILVRDALLDGTNGVFFESDQTQNHTSASIFRLKGRPLLRRI